MIPRSLSHSSLLIPKRCVNTSLTYRPFSSSIIRRETIGHLPNGRPLPPPPKSQLRRFVGASAILTIFTVSAFVITMLPTIKAMEEATQAPTAAESLTLFEPYDDISKEVEEHINTHPLALKLRADPRYTESRPHLRMGETIRRHSLTANTLMGAGKMIVPPVIWTGMGETGPELISISYVGQELCGHPGVLHGGFLATVLDEALVRACTPALPNQVGVTANLNVTYKAPSMADNYLCLRARTVKVEGRKAWVEGWIETLVDESKGEKPMRLVEASALVIEPKNIATLLKAFPMKD